MSLSQCLVTETGKLTIFHHAAGDGFGTSLSVDGDVAVLGAPGSDFAGGDAGAAYVYRFDGVGWVETAILVASDTVDGDHFGVSVSVSGETIVVGATWIDEYDRAMPGAAYIFRFDGAEWVEEARLVSDDPMASDNFGLAAAIFGDTVVIAAPADIENGEFSGAAYVFRHIGGRWNREQKLLVSDGGAYDHFGSAVDAGEDIVVIGAIGYHRTGEAFVYRFDGGNWTAEARLLNQDSRKYEDFGSSISISGDRVLVGDDHAVVSDARKGAAYIYRFNGSDWRREATLVASDGEFWDEFGYSASLDGDFAVIGAPRSLRGGTTAYVFRFADDRWIEDAMLTLTSDRHVTVSVSGDHVVVGAPRNSRHGSASGSASTFRRRESGWEPLGELPPEDLTSERFGYSIDIDGDLAVVGSSVTWSRRPGAARVFRFDGSGWFQEARLEAGEPALDDGFGTAAAISGATVIVGAMGDDTIGEDAGAAYVFVFDKGEWVLRQKILPDDDATDEQFGVSVAMFGDLAVIGAWGPEMRYGMRGPGSAYAYRFDGSSWVREFVFGAPDDARGFGSSIALHADIAVVGAPSESLAFAYRRHGPGDWSEPEKIGPTQPAGRFGWSVDLQDRTLVVGSPYDDDFVIQSGSAFVFGFDGSRWVQQQRLLASDGSPGQEFGNAVAVRGDAIVIATAPNYNYGSGPGDAYLFRHDGVLWSEQAKLIRSNGNQNGLLGGDVALTGQTAWYGAISDSSNGRGSGAVYIYDFDASPDPCDVNCNGFVSTRDIGPFLDLLYGDGTPCCPTSGDVNGDGVVDAFDIEPFLDCIFP